MFFNPIDIFPMLVILLGLLFGVPVILRWLWNLTMNPLFALKQITYWQSFRLFMLSFLLIGIWTVI